MATKQETPYFKFDIFTLSDLSKGVQYEDQILLIDNLDDENTIPVSAMKFLDFPVKTSCVVIILCAAGSIEFQLNLHSYTLKPGDVIIALEGSIGQFIDMSDDCRLVAMAFSPDYFRISESYSEALELFHRIFLSPVCHLDENGLKEALTIYSLMKAKMSEPDNPFRKGALNGYVSVLSHCANYYMLGSGAMGQSERPSRSQEFYNQFITLVKANYTKERSIAFYADKMGVTPKYLSQIIRKASGRLAGDWIRDFVILEAKALLKSNRYTVQQVSAQLNFPNQSFFGRYFKENVGCSPSEYQKS